MKKKIIIALIGIGMCFSLIGCSGNTDTETVNTDENIEEDVEEETGKWTYDEENDIWIWQETVDGEVVNSGLTIQVVTD